MPNRIRVLLVDDHALVRRGFRRILEDEPDITVAGEASDGEEAVRLAQQLRPQVIVMDCALPGMNGLDLLARLGEELKNVPAIIITGKGSEERIILCRRRRFSELHVIEDGTRARAMELLEHPAVPRPWKWPAVPERGE